MTLAFLTHYNTELHSFHVTDVGIQVFIQTYIKRERQREKGGGEDREKETMQ